MSVIGSRLSPFFFSTASHIAHILVYVVSSSDELVDLLFSRFPSVCVYAYKLET
jgi:hypothetical protein